MLLSMFSVNIPEFFMVWSDGKRNLEGNIIADMFPVA